MSKPITYEVDKNGCWNCTSHSTDTGGYPNIYRNARIMHLSRFIWIEKNGPIPDGMVIRHKCDNPLCINLEHLEVGTQADNIQDMIKRKRARFSNPGEQNGRARLSAVDVIDIRKRYKNGERQVDIAKRYGVSRHLIWDVIKRKWKHLQQDVCL